MNTQWIKPLRLAKRPQTQSLIVALLIGIFSANGLFGTTWYTINPGTYLNSTNVWSLDGTTACGCTPGFNIGGPFDSVFVRHDIVLDSDVRLNGRSEFFVDPNASLIGPHDLLVANASFTNRGDLSVVDVTLFLGGHLFAIENTNLSGTLTNNEARVELSGSMNVDGDFLNRSGGFVQIFANATMYVGNGYLNDGVTDIAPGGCVNIIADFTNPNRGNVSGGGYIRSFNNIENNGFWEPTVSWCAEGQGRNLPTQPNCVNCGTLPVELLAFDAVYHSDVQEISLQWSTSYELNNDYFTVERSTDGQHFDLVSVVPGSANATNGARYSALDQAPLPGEVIYRLRQTDKDGAEKVIGLALVNASGPTRTDVQVYPNPFSDRVQFSVRGSESARLSVNVRDLHGRLLHTQQIEDAAYYHHGEITLGHLAAGTYLLELHSGTASEVRKLIKQ
ncbi:MAG: T9SS type A sorting domain-containing protein [Bacteroidota bacterium]